MRRSTFTLIEMLVVICILLILMGLGASGVNKVLQNNAKKQTVLGVRTVVAACEQYKNRYGFMPGSSTSWAIVNFGGDLHDNSGSIKADGTAETGMAKVRANSKKFIDFTALELNQTGTQIKDYWDKPLYYKYTATGDYIEIRSDGPDTATTDDIYSSGP